MNKYPLVGIAAILVLGGGWRYFNQSSAPAPVQQAPKPTTPTSREDVKVGDKVGSLVVTDIKVIALPTGDPKKDLRISFSGETTVTGTYAVGGFSGPDEVSIAVSKTNNPQLPYFLLDPEARQVFIVLSNSSAARQALVSNSGNTSIRIKNLSAAWATGTEAVTTAEFVDLAQ